MTSTNPSVTCGRTSLWTACAALALLGGFVHDAAAQGPVPGVPYAQLVPASTMLMPAEPDSNSPVVWTNAAVGGATITIFHSTLTGPALSRGSTLMPTAPPSLVNFVVQPPYNVWFEAVLVDSNGTWYAYYHDEVPASTVCPGDARHMPAIGSARSFDNGQTWEDMGRILEAPIGSHLCSSPNLYFVGGVGDFSALLNPGDNYLYIFFSQYSNVLADQGIAVARLPWADRNTPAGRVTVYRDGRWEPAYVPEGQLVPGVPPQYRYKSGTPIFPTTRSWHATDRVSNAFWGPSVHFNTRVNGFVMLMNHTADVDWAQEGIYVTFANSMTDWTHPQRLIAGGGWYPQVIGTEHGSGTDRLAGDLPRLFVRGVSTNLLQFSPRTPGGVQPEPVDPGATENTGPVKLPPIEMSTPEPMLPAAGSLAAAENPLAAPVASTPASAPALPDAVSHASDGVTTAAGTASHPGVTFEAAAPAALVVPAPTAASVAAPERPMPARRLDVPTPQPSASAPAADTAPASTPAPQGGGAWLWPILEPVPSVGRDAVNDAAGERTNREGRTTANECTRTESVEGAGVSRATEPAALEPAACSADAPDSSSTEVAPGAPVEKAAPPVNEPGQPRLPDA